MSIESVNQFLQKVAQDTQLQEEIAKAMESENDRQAVVELGAKYGYQFTSDELGQEIQKNQQAAVDSGELSEDELEAVAGGACTPMIFKGTVKLTAAVSPAAIGRAKW
jgi:predicted ribosomally synthesized peptide with nif11-like leader